MHTTASRGATDAPTHQQEEARHSGRHHYEPTLEVIAAECQAIQEGWSHEERLRRMGAHANDFGPMVHTTRKKGVHS